MCAATPAGDCTVEQVQDIVESMLIRYDYEKTAKAYILYRAEHAKIREAESDLMNIYNELTYADSKDADIKRENANIDGDTAMGTMLKYGSEGAKYYVDHYVLPKDIAKAHRPRVSAHAPVHHELRLPGLHCHPGQPERDARRAERPQL